MASPDPDLDLLRALVAVADTQSFTRAGERLGRTQSAVSLQIKRLEEALGATLLDRSPHRVRLTADGEAALACAHRILTLKDELVMMLREGSVAGSVRIGAPEDFATRLLPPVLARFQRSHPSVSLETTCALTLTLLDGFRDGAFDIVLVKRAPGQLRDAHGVTGEGLWREPLVWVSDADGEAIHRDPLPLAVAPEPCVHRKRAIEALNRAGRSWRLAYQCESLAGLRAAVAAGLGVSVLPRGALAGLSGEVGPNQRLQAIEPVSGDSVSRLPALEPVEIALLTADPLSEPASLLAGHLRRALSELAPSGSRQPRWEDGPED